MISVILILTSFQSLIQSIKFWLQSINLILWNGIFDTLEVSIGTLKSIGDNKKVTELFRTGDLRG